MRTKRVIFKGRALPLALLAPQLAITFVFFLWPAGQALMSSLYREDAFGLSRQFVGLANFRHLFNDPLYLDSLQVTAVFSAATAVSAMGIALLFAFMVDRIGRSARHNHDNAHSGCDQQ